MESYYNLRSKSSCIGDTTSSVHKHPLSFDAMFNSIQDSKMRVAALDGSHG